MENEKTPLVANIPIYCIVKERKLPPGTLGPKGEPLKNSASKHRKMYYSIAIEVFLSHYMHIMYGSMHGVVTHHHT